MFWERVCSIRIMLPLLWWCCRADYGIRSGQPLFQFQPFSQYLAWTSLVTQVVKNLPATQETWVWSLGWEDALEKGMATYPSLLAWRTPWIGQPGRIQSLGSQRVGHDWATNTFTFKYLPYLRWKFLEIFFSLSYSQPCPENTLKIHIHWISIFLRCIKLIELFPSSLFLPSSKNIFSSDTFYSESNL